jgi:hypothetical protein
MMGSVAVVITSTLLLLWFLDNPYHLGVSGLRPTAMQRTLGLLSSSPESPAGGSRFHATGREWRVLAESRASLSRARTRRPLNRASPRTTS